MDRHVARKADLNEREGIEIIFSMEADPVGGPAQFALRRMWQVTFPPEINNHTVGDYALRRGKAIVRIIAAVAWWREAYLAQINGLGRAISCCPTL